MSRKKNSTQEEIKIPAEEAPLPAGFFVLKKMQKFLIFGSLGIFLFSLFLVDISVFAGDKADLMGSLSAAGTNAGFGTRSIGESIANIVQIILGVLGVVFIILIIYAGFLWMTASGNDEQIKSAQGHLRNAIIGVMIVIGAQIVTYWVLYNVTQATLPPQNYDYGGGALVPDLPSPPEEPLPTVNICTLDTPCGAICLKQECEKNCRCGFVDGAVEGSDYKGQSVDCSSVNKGIGCSCTGTCPACKSTCPGDIDIGAASSTFTPTPSNPPPFKLSPPADSGGGGIQLKF